MKVPTDKLIGELHRTQPYTMVVVLALSAFAIWSYAKHATADDVKTLSERVAKVETEVEEHEDEEIHAGADTRLSLLEQDVDYTKKQVDANSDKLDQIIDKLTE